MNGRMAATVVAMLVAVVAFVAYRLALLEGKRVVILVAASMVVPKVLSPKAAPRAAGTMEGAMVALRVMAMVACKEELLAGRLVAPREVTVEATAVALKAWVAAVTALVYRDRAVEEAVMVLGCPVDEALMAEQRVGPPVAVLVGWVGAAMAAMMAGATEVSTVASSVVLGVVTMAVAKLDMLEE